MTQIRDMHDMPDQRERIRREILDMVETRRQEAETSLSKVIHFCGAIYLGGTAGSIGFIASINTDINQTTTLFVSSGIILFSLSSISYAWFLYQHYTLHNKRYNTMSDHAERFFRNECHLEDVLGAIRQHQNALVYKLLFYIPMVFAMIGLLCNIAASFTYV